MAFKLNEMLIINYRARQAIETNPTTLVASSAKPSPKATSSISRSLIEETASGDLPVAWVIRSLVLTAFCLRASLLNFCDFIGDNFYSSESVIK
ncbi:MAG: hypothetical protein AAFZ35_16935 [Cyanobacteria bacterium J06649_12]